MQPETIALPSDADLATYAVRVALHAYSAVDRKPHRVQAWAYVEEKLWNARQDALRTGIIERGSKLHRILSSRYTMAQQKREQGRALEAQGHLDVRI